MTSSPNVQSEPREGQTLRGASLVGSGTLVRRVWFTMVLVPTKGWTRVGKAYGSEKSARGWLRFVSQAWHGLRTKTAQCTLRWQDGVMDERSRRTLSEKFNMEPPAAPPNTADEARCCEHSMDKHNSTDTSATAQRTVASGPLVRRTIYRNFRVIERDGEIRILSACGDSHPADSLADAHQQIDSWYKEGSVEL